MSILSVINRSATVDLDLENLSFVLFDLKSRITRLCKSKRTNDRFSPCLTPRSEEKKVGVLAII